MKKIILFLAFVAVTSFSAQAQQLGARFGDGPGGNFAVDGLFELGQFSRVHADVSFGKGLGVEALYDFMYKPVGDEEQLFWYVGAGVSMIIDDPFFLGASGELGMEYIVKGAPISISADWRPTFWIIENTDFSANGFGINVRYVFDK
jgi:hypothetical protein